MIKGVELQLLFGPGVPVPAPRAAIEALTGVTIEENAGETPSGFELSFAVDKSSPLVTAFLLAGGTALPILRVSLAAAMNGRMVPLINGVVTRADMAPGNAGAPATLKVLGKDLTAAMAVLDFSGLPYPAMPPFARVALILAKYAWLGVIPQVIPSLEPPPLPTDRIPRQKSNDLDYVRSLARDAGYTFHMAPGPAAGTSFAYWGPEIRLGEVQPALTVDSGPATNCEELSFAFDKEGTELPIVFIQNALTKAPIPIPIPSAIPFHPPLGLVPPLPPKIVPLTDTAHLNPLEALARGFAHAARHSDAVTGRGRIDVLRYGRPLRARGLIGVRGAGRAFDGVHYLETVRHEIARGAWKQSFTLKRGGLLPTSERVPA